VCSCCSKAKATSEIPTEVSTNFQERTTANTRRSANKIRVRRENTESCNFRFTAKYIPDENAFCIVKFGVHNHIPSNIYSVSVLLITLILF
jgi:hypothetical protein